MKKELLRITSIILCIAFVFSSLTFTSSAEELQTEMRVDTADISPMILIPGMGMSETTLFDDDGNIAKNKDGSEFESWTIFSLYTDEIVKNLWKFVPLVILSFVFQHDIGLTKIIEKYAPSLFKYAEHDKEGNSVENVKAVLRSYPISEYDEKTKSVFYRMLPFQDYAPIMGEDKMYVYNFAAFSNIYDEATGLRNLIKEIKQNTGCEKVTLVPVSLGGTVATAYFDLYKEECDVDRVINIVAALGGSDLVADSLAYDYADDAPELFYRTLAPLMLNDDIGYLINIIVRMIPRSLAKGIADAAMEAMINTVIRNTPSMWALVPPDRYEELANKYLIGEEYKTLRKQTDRYHKAQSNLEEQVRSLTEDYGVEIYNICGCDLEFGKGWDFDYNYFRLYKSSKGSNSDGIIQISSTGMGTDSVPAGTEYNKEVPDGKLYCTDENHNHIKASVNAATCYLPEHTWYFVGQHHEIAYNDVVVEVVCKILLREIEDVYSDPAYPQFNGTRYVREITRHYLPDANNLDRSNLTEDQIRVLDEAVAQMNAVLSSTIADDKECKEAEKKLQEALAYCGALEVDSMAKIKSFLDEAFYNISESLYALIGPRGFFDVLTFKKY